MSKNHFVGLDCGASKILFQKASYNLDLDLVIPFGNSIEVLYSNNKDWIKNFSPVPIQNQLKQLFPSLQDFNAIVNGQVNTEQVKPPEAKDQLEAQNSTNEILSKQANDIKLLREQNKELLEKMNSNISRLRR